MAARAILYVRVSTQEQAQEGVSLLAQESRLRAYCSMMKLEVVAVLREEGVSAFKPLAERPQGEKLLKLLEERQAEHVVAVKLDRLFRNTADCCTRVLAWEKAGVGLHLVDMGGMALNTTTAVGKMFLQMMACFAEFERNLTSERTKVALAHLKEQGVVPGPKAWREGCKRARELRAKGWSNRRIAAQLTAEGVETARGGTWASAHVSRMLKAEVEG